MNPVTESKKTRFLNEDSNRCEYYLEEDSSSHMVKREDDSILVEFSKNPDMRKQEIERLETLRKAIDLTLLELDLPF